MAQFYSSWNNGVCALIRKDDAEKYGQMEDAGKDPFAEDSGVKVFTFTKFERLAKHRNERRTFTGNLDFMERLTKGHKVDVNNGSLTGWSGFVPFSNQEHVWDAEGDWQRFCTTAADVVEKFELLS